MKQRHAGSSCALTNKHDITMKRWNKRKLCLFACLALLMGMLYSCSEDNPSFFATLHGTVTDYETGELIENAVVTLSPLNITQRTDKTGSFCFRELEPQSFTIIVQKTDYQPNRKTITAVSGEEIEINIPLVKIENEDDN